MTPISRVALTTLAALLAAPALAAQFAAFSWSYVGEPTGFASVDGETAHVEGAAFQASCEVDGTSRLVATASVSGWVFAHYLFDNQDGGFGWWAAEDPIVVHSGGWEYVGPIDVFDTWEGDVAFAVDAGESFGFGVKSLDCLEGPGVLDVSDFEFVPNAWDDLGGALAGAAGEPTLKGLGPLAPGTPWTLSLIEAAPVAPAWLVLSTATSFAPFKGGVMVPDAGAALFKPAVTGAAGRIVWSGSWPEGIAPEVPLVAQWWVADAGAPVGWAASNAVTRTTR